MGRVNFISLEKTWFKSEFMLYSFLNISINSLAQLNHDSLSKGMYLNADDYKEVQNVHWWRVC